VVAAERGATAPHAVPRRGGVIAPPIRRWPGRRGRHGGQPHRRGRWRARSWRWRQPTRTRPRGSG